MSNPSPSAKDAPLRLSRRSLFAGSASLVATALAPAALAQPTQSTESELTALGAKFEHALGVHQAAQRHRDECEQRFWAACPDPPEALTQAGPLGRWLKHDWMYFTARDLRAALRDPDRRADWPAAQDVLADALAYEARERRLARRIGLRAAERAHEAAIEALESLSVEILGADTRSRAALAVKGRAIKAWGKPEWWSTDEGHADPYERFAAQLIDTVIAAAV